MASVYLGIGSNIEREQHIVAGIDELAALLGPLRLSSVYDSEAIGFSGAPFLNLVAEARTCLSVGDLVEALRTIEYRYGRSRSSPRNAPRRLDIDLLLYDAACGLIDGIELPRGEILENAFVLAPLAELVPEQRHPVAGETYRALWSRYGADRQRLKAVPFTWRGRPLPLDTTDL